MCFFHWNIHQTSNFLIQVLYSVYTFIGWQVLYYPATDFLSLFPENEHDENSNFSRKRMARCLENSLLIFSPTDSLAWAASFTSSKAIQDVKMHLAHFGHDLLDWLESSCTKIPYSESRFESWKPLYSCLWVTEKIGIELEFCRKGFLQNLHKELTN